MAENLVIRLTEHDTDTVEWMLTDDSGARQGAPVRGTLRAAADAAGGRQISVLLPASEILLTSADIPAKGARLLQALPFALEEQLADDVDKLHFAAGTRRSSGRTPVAVIRRDQLQDFLDKLDEAGIKPSGIYAETQGLARIPGTISLLIDGDNLLLNDGADVELAMQQISPGDALVAIGALDDHAVGAESDDDTEGTPLPSHVLV
ncbi:MAG: type II secretion system protein GspL, partial [Pseudomonadota bacterium]